MDFRGENGISRESGNFGKSDGVKFRLKHFRPLLKKDSSRKIIAEAANESIRSEQSHALTSDLCFFLMRIWGSLGATKAHPASTKGDVGSTNGERSNFWPNVRVSGRTLGKMNSEI